MTTNPPNQWISALAGRDTAGSPRRIRGCRVGLGEPGSSLRYRECNASRRRMTLRKD